MCNNYVKVISSRPPVRLERMQHFVEEVGSRQFEELWFFDDTDVASTNAALDKARAFRERQPNGTRFSTSVWRPIAAAPHIPEVGSPPKGMRRAA